MRKIYPLVITFCLVALGNLHAQSINSRSTSSDANIAREDEYDVHFYWLDLDLEYPSSYISGNVMVQATSVVSALDTFSLDLDGSAFTVDSVKASLNLGAFQNAQFSQSGNDLVIILPFTAGLNQTVQTSVYYHGTAGVSSNGYPDGEAFFVGSTQNFSASPPYNSCTWWPCKQNLTDKADSSWFFITTDSSNVTASNGVLVNAVPKAGGKKQYQWKSHHKIDFYLISFVVGKYALTTEYFHPTGRTDSMPVLFYGLSPSYTLDVLQKYSKLFGLYPFYDEKFGLASVYLGGGMENQTIVSLGIQGTVIEHETMHQWFGDNVTCGSYKDLWLNEGFARWAESLYPELAAPDSSANAARINVANQYENGSVLYGPGGLGYSTGSVYYYNTDTVDILTLYGGEGRGMNYEKAAMMINSLRFEINNDSIFFLGLKNYQTQYAGKTALSNDLVDVMENTTGMDLTDFFNQWLWGYGYPTFNIKWNQKSDKLALAITEIVSDSAKTPLFKTSLELKIKRSNGSTESDTIIRIFVSQNLTEMTIPCGDSVTGFVVDPNQWILNGVGTILKDTTLSMSTGVQTTDKTVSEYHLYPNPTSEYVYIQYSGTRNKPVDAELYNTMGQVVLHQKVYPNEPIYLHGLPNGLYLLQLNQLNSCRVVIER